MICLMKRMVKAIFWIPEEELRKLEVSFGGGVVILADYHKTAWHSDLLRYLISPSKGGGVFGQFHLKYANPQ